MAPLVELYGTASLNFDHAAQPLSSTVNDAVADLSVGKSPSLTGNAAGIAKHDGPGAGVQGTRFPCQMRGESRARQLRRIDDTQYAGLACSFVSNSSGNRAD